MEQALDPNASLPQQAQRKAKRPALYEVGKDGHYGACQAISSQGKAPDPNMYTGPWVNIHHGLEGGYRDILSTYWQGCLRHLEDADHNYKEHQLPLARIKKVMKADEEVKMISAEAPILFAKGCDIFITELTMRAWIHAEENKRRTLQRSDIAAALTKSDMFDFLIDIVPREESAGASHAKRPQAGGVTQSTATQPQAQQQAQHHAPNQHHPGPEYGGFPSHMPQEQDFRTQPGMYGVPPGQSDASGYPAAPPHMFDQNMYAGYGLPPQQMYTIPQRGPEPTGGQHYRPHDAGDGTGGGDAERDYNV